MCKRTLILARPGRVLRQGQPENDYAQVPTEHATHQRNGERIVSKEILGSKLHEEKKEA